MFALVHEKKVIQLSDEKFEVASGLEWIASGDHTEVGWTLNDDGSLTAPTPPSLETVKEEALSTIANHHAQALNDLTGKATPEERNTWAIKAAAAKAYLAKTADADQTALLGQEVKVTGETIDELTARITAKSRKYHLLAGKASGLKRKAEKRVQDCQSPDEIDALLTTLATEMRSAIIA